MGEISPALIYFSGKGERDRASIHQVYFPNTQSFVPVICHFTAEAKPVMWGFTLKGETHPGALC